MLVIIIMVILLVDFVEHVELVIFDCLRVGRRLVGQHLGLRGVAALTLRHEVDGWHYLRCLLHALHALVLLQNLARPLSDLIIWVLKHRVHLVVRVVLRKLFLLQRLAVEPESLQVLGQLGLLVR